MAKRCVKGRILLCKGVSSKEYDTQESYRTVLEAAEYICDILPTLKFEFTGLDKLRKCLSEPQSYSGLVLTSPRSVESIKIATNNNPSLLEPWKKMPAYCVGSATTCSAKNSLDLTNFPSDDRADGQNSKHLAQFIVNFHAQASPLLYPCSEIARDTVEQVLTNNNVAIEKLISYKTTPSDTLEVDLEKLMKDNPKYFVLFSPSVANCVLPLLAKKFEKYENVKLIAIGPVTSEEITKMGSKVDAVSEKPEPAALLKAVESCA